jgi:radical SAM enzyme (TIGR01210 family)
VLTDQQILSLRGPKAPLAPQRAYAAVWEEEPDADGALVPTAVVFLTNRECPFRCVMCDLWVHTLDDSVADGVIPEQIRAALAGLPPARQVKLYNAGSFFDSQAIPPGDDEAIAGELAAFARVIVEAHPAYLRGPYGERCLRLAERLPGRLEVAIGLETANADVLARLNKRMTLDDFHQASGFLRAHDIDVRAFVLLQPTFMRAEEAVEWGCRSIDVAFDAGASVCSVIPTRGGNGAMEAVAATPPPLTALESVLEYGVVAGRGRVFADLWDVERFYSCRCSPERAARLRAMNRTQRIATPVLCDCATRI